MNTILSWLTPWWAKALAGAVLLFSLWTAWQSFVGWVSAPAVETALEKERAEKQPIIDELAKRVADRDSIIAEIEDKSIRVLKKAQEENEVKQRELGYALTKLKQSNVALAKLHSDNTDFLRMLDTIASDNRINDPTSASARLIKLGAAYSQCEKEYRAESVEHAETLGRLDEALAVVRALKQ